MINQTNFIEIINVLFSFIIGLCAFYLSYVALKHSARPKVKLKMLSPKVLHCNKITLFKFEFSNVGYWYTKPPVINLIVFCNFENYFEPLELLYGSNQSIKNNDVKIGKGTMKYLKAKGLKLIYGEEGEEVHVKVKTPKIEGKYKIRVSAYSENGASIKKTFIVTCIDKNSEELRFC